MPETNDPLEELRKEVNAIIAQQDQEALGRGEQQLADMQNLGQSIEKSIEKRQKLNKKTPYSSQSLEVLQGKTQEFQSTIESVKQEGFEGGGLILLKSNLAYSPEETQRGGFMLLSIPELEPKGPREPKELAIAKMVYDFDKMQDSEEKLIDLKQLEQDIQESIGERKNAGDLTHFSENCLRVLQIQVQAFQDFLEFASKIKPKASEEQDQQKSNKMAGMTITSNRDKESKKSSTNRARESRRNRLTESMGKKSSL